jgi:hypothetical protein
VTLTGTSVPAPEVTIESQQIGRLAELFTAMPSFTYLLRSGLSVSPMKYLL